MPPEPLSWDNNRRGGGGGGGDFRRQQHDRSGSEPRGFGFGSSSSHHRWRENQNHHQHNHGYHHGTLPHAPSPSSYHHQQQQRWYSDFRSSRPLPHPYPGGHGKQGGWHMHPDDAANGFVPFGSRYADRSLEDENCRPFGSRGGDGRYFRNNRDNRSSFAQKEWRTSSWEPAASPSGPGRPNTEANSPRPIENSRSLHDNGNKSIDASRSQADAVKSSGQSQFVVTEQLDNNSGPLVGQKSSDQKLEKKDGAGSTEWKPLKWSRSGSLTSRSSGLSQSSCSKSIGVESNHTVAEVEVKNAAAVQNPCADSVPCATSTASAPSDDGTGCRKKPRLGWGEGLAKYEKKKVEGPEDVTTSNELVDVGGVETLQSLVVIVPEHSPRAASLSDCACASPATPSSVACSTSPGAMVREIVKKSMEPDTTNFSCSPGIVSSTNYNEPALNLESLDLASIADVSSSIDELLRSDNQSAAETGYVGTSSINKLMILKSDMLKALEITESEIDSLETELKSFGSETRSDRPFAAVSSSQLAECPLKACEESGSGSYFAAKPISLQIVPPENIVIENAAVALEQELVGSKDEDFDSPTSATSKFVEVLPTGQDIFLCEMSEHVEDCVNSDCKSSSHLDKKCLNNGFHDEEMTDVGDNHALRVINTCEELESVSNVEDICDAIFASNKELASKAWEELSKLLPAKQCLSNVTTAFDLSCFPRSSSMVKDEFLMRRRFFQCKEKVLAIKFRVFQHFWKQGRMVSVKKLRLKVHKNCDLSLTGLKKKRSSSRFRILSPAGGPQTVPTAEVIEYTKSLLLQSHIKPCRNTLKMPAFILDKEMKMSRFISTNGLAEDPCAIEHEKSMINPWTIEEKKIFEDKLTVFGKDFRIIASFLEHKTTADCIEFYYKNHKSECFDKVRKKPDSMKQRKSQSNTYLIASGKKWNRGSNAASLDILGAASAIAASGNDGLETQKKYTSTFALSAARNSKALRNDGLFRRSHSPDMYSYEKETVAADVLAGICGSFLSEAVSSSITSSVDPCDGSLEWRSHRIRASMRCPLTPEDTLNADDECSDETYEEVDSSDWTDEEKSVFLRALSSYGKDFAMISQCVGTRSKEQCNLFYSKSRKRLGLDLIRPGVQSCADFNVNGDDSDDANAMETGSMICNNGSESTMEGDRPPSDVKLNHESDTVGMWNSTPDSNMCEETYEPGPLNSMTAEPILKNELKGCSHIHDKAYQDFKVSSKEQNVEKEIDSSFPNGLCETAVNKKVEDVDTKSEGVSGSSFGASEVKSGPSLARNGSQSSEEVHSSVQDVSDLYIGKSMEKSHCSLQQQTGHLESMESSTLFSVPIKYQKIFNCDTPSITGANGIRDPQKIVMENDSQQQLPCCSLSDSVDSSQILKGYPVSVQTVKDINGDINCKWDGNFGSDHYAECFLRKCNGSSSEGKIGKTQFLTPKLSRDCSTSQSVSSLEVGTSSSSGDLKLFGKILVSSQQKSNVREQEKEGQSLHLNCKVNSDSSKLNLDWDNYTGSENIPLHNSGLWDRNHMQMNYPPLPDSARLLAKYPDSFSNYPMSTIKLGQSQLNGTIRISDNPLNGVSVLSSKAVSNNGLGNHSPLMNNGISQHPFVVDTQQRNNRFELVSGMRQQSRGTIGMNGNFVGGQCPVVVSDPVAAIKMHFEKQMENIVKGDCNKRMSNGDVGR